MDRKIEQKKGLKRRHIPYIAGGLFVVAVGGWIVLGDHSSQLKVDAKTLSIETVTNGLFNDYVRVSGAVLPITTVQLSPLEGGMVDEKVVEEGAKVKKGDVIVRLSNPQLNIAILESEASLAEKENFLRNTRVQMEQEKLNLRKERLQLDLDVTRKHRAYEQKQALYDEKLVAREEYIQAKEDYDIAVKQAVLVLERQKQDSIFRLQQVENMELNLASMQRNMALVRQRVDNLSVRSPIDGELGMLDIVLGQSVASGQKMGQINDLTSYKIEAMIDEHYIDRVREGLDGTFERGGETFALRVAKVFPEVRSGQFRTWLYLVGAKPDNMRAGQTYYINLELGQPTESIIIARGAFYQTTGGAWIYVMDGDNRAVRRQIKIGRQNPQFYEVIEGLKAGEKVIVSSYDTYGDNETLIIR
ncbi:MAG: efflux RND transporter periplasmic adaptor subunit [Mucinivorans sp.]